VAATIDATIKGANANSYATLAEANDAYFETVSQILHNGIINRMIRKTEL
jgi:hypothetical protein